MIPQMSGSDLKRYYQNTVLQRDDNNKLVYAAERIEHSGGIHEMICINADNTEDRLPITQLSPFIPQEGFYENHNNLVILKRKTERQWKKSFAKTNHSLMNVTWLEHQMLGPPINIPSSAITSVTRQEFVHTLEKRLTETPVFDGAGIEAGTELFSIINPRYAVVNFLFSKVPLVINTTQVIGRFIDGRVQLEPETNHFREELSQYVEVA